MRRFVFCCLLSLSTISGWTQDYNFVNGLHFPQMINAAGTGSGSIYQTQVTVMHRGQWENVSTQDAYQGSAVVADMRFCLQNSRKNFYALGLSLQHDFSTLGGFFNTQGALQAAYHQHLGEETFLAAGASLGALAYGVQEGKLRFDEQFQNGFYSPNHSNGESFASRNEFQPDLGAGVFLYNNDRAWSMGISWKHLNRPLYSLLDEENRLGPSFILHGSWTVKKHTNRIPGLHLKGMVRRQSFSGQNSKQWQALAGIFLTLKLPDSGATRFWVGSSLRTGSIEEKSFIANTLIPSIHLVTNRYSCSLSYDADLEKIRTQFAGGLELAFSYSFGQRDRCVVCAGF